MPRMLRLRDKNKRGPREPRRGPRGQHVGHDPSCSVLINRAVLLTGEAFGLLCLQPRVRHERVQRRRRGVQSLMLYGHLLRQQCYGVVAGPVVSRSEVGRETVRMVTTPVHLFTNPEPGLWSGWLRLGRAVWGLHLCDPAADSAD